MPCALDAHPLPGVSLGSVLAEQALSPYLVRGTLYLTDDPLVVGRFVDVRVPRIDPDRILRRAASPAPDLAEPPRPASDGLAAYAGLPALVDAATVAAPGRPRRRAHAARRRRAVRLAGRAARGRPASPPTEVDAAVRGAPDRTTLLSATLLDCALHGEVLPEFAAYVAALGTPAEPDAARSPDWRSATPPGAGLWFGAHATP